MYIVCIFAHILTYHVYIYIYTYFVYLHTYEFIEKLIHCQLQVQTIFAVNVPRFGQNHSFPTFDRKLKNKILPWLTFWENPPRYNSKS